MDRLSRGAKAGEACHGRMKQSLLMLYVGALTQRYQQMTRRKRCLRRRSRSHRPDGSFLCPSFLAQASRCADTKIQQESALAWFFQVSETYVNLGGQDQWTRQRPMQRSTCMETEKSCCTGGYMMRKHGSKYGGEMQGKSFDMLLICNRRIVGAGTYAYTDSGMLIRDEYGACIGFLDRPVTLPNSWFSRRLADSKKRLVLNESEICLAN